MHKYGNEQGKDRVEESRGEVIMTGFDHEQTAVAADVNSQSD